MKKGVTFLLAVIISSLALSLGLGMAFIFTEELKLSGTGKESFAAFFAADSGAECALFWDLEQNQFPTTITTFNIRCNNQTFTQATPGVTRTLTLTKFDLGLSGGTKCAKVKVDKSFAPLTIITSLGQNVGCSAPASPRNVQRGIEIRY